MPTLYGIKNCDTIKKARKWLDQNGIDYRFHDYREDGLTTELLKNFLARSDWQTLLNQRSTSWRQLDAAQKSDLDEDKALKLMLETPTLIKRPVLDNGGQLVVGFKAEQYQAEFDL
ncbi:ArsC family reductase [Methylotuvimicrobium sp. KM1]|uniref:ArsC family reductase n=1 Tax=Methylotuvimicrobium sp. KM1 TaxID=3377707 RepID=UPI00384E63EF